jgi:phospholipid/cholesterol/gamma-HCH transport system substrate-binding protein
MNDTRIELKVGFFVAVGLALLAVLVLSFSRGLTLFNSSYQLRLILPSAAGLKPTADVMMAGVPIGKASELALLPDGRSVQVTVSILSKYKIRTNAVFHVDALGFLGDQYIEVTPFDQPGRRFLAARRRSAGRESFQHAASGAFGGRPAGSGQKNGGRP